MKESQSEIYTVREVQIMLGLSRTATYALMQDPPFVVHRIGNAIRISKRSFDEWLNGGTTCRKLQKYHN